MAIFKPSILVPINFSESSVHAAKYAYLVASHLKGKVILFHSYYSPSLDLVDLVQGRGKKQLKKELSESVNSSAIKQMNVFKQIMSLQLPQHVLDKISVNEHIVQGLPEQEIITFEKENEVYLIIMGSHGKTLQEEPIMANITRKIIQRTQTPTLVIPADYHFVGIENVRNIAYLTEFDEADFESMKKLVVLTRNFSVNIFCIHFSKQKNTEELNNKLDAFKNYFNNFFPGSKINCSKIDAQEDLSELNNYILENDIKLLAITTRKRSLIVRPFKKDFGSSLFYHTNIPLLFLHD